MTDVFTKSKGVTEKITIDQFLVEDTSCSGAEKMIYDHLDGQSNFEVSSVSESKITTVIQENTPKHKKEESLTQ